MFASYKVVRGYMPQSERELILWEVALFGLLFCVFVSFYAAAVVLVLFCSVMVWLFKISE